MLRQRPSEKNEQCFGSQIAADFAEEGRQEENTADKADNEKKGQLADTAEHFCTGNGSAAAAMVESMTIIMIPEISSNTRIPKVNCVKRSFKSPSSSKVLLTTAVEDMVSIAPAKRLSIGCQPSSLAQA